MTQTILRINKVQTASAVGIDVAKATLSVCIRCHEGSERALSIGNTEADIRKKLIPRLAGFSGKIVMESTGHYHWLAALTLSGCGFDVRVVNPILCKQYTSATIRKVKTDPADASGLARMAELADNLPEPFTLTPQRLHARKKLSIMGSLKRQLQALSASLKALQEANGILQMQDSPAEKEIIEVAAALKRSLAHLEAEFVRDAKKDAGQTERLALLESIPGVSPFCAALALHWFESAPSRDPKSWIAYAGLDISSRESGTWRGKCRLTKRGNNYLRARLYASAWGAVMNDPNMRSYYELLRKQGRAYVESLIIIARKIVRTMFMVLRNNTPYDASQWAVVGV